jgi:DNA-binding IclR family transcriptional regulator
MDAQCAIATGPHDPAFESSRGGVAGAAPPRSRPPHKDETPGIAGQGLVGEKEETDDGDCASAMAKRKRNSRVVAALALRGFALRFTRVGKFIVPVVAVVADARIGGAA